MKKLVLSVCLALLMFQFIAFAVPAKVEAFVWPQECQVIVWNASTIATCVWAFMIEIYGSGGDWPD